MDFIGVHVYMSTLSGLNPEIQAEIDSLRTDCISLPLLHLHVLQPRCLATPELATLLVDLWLVNQCRGKRFDHRKATNLSEDMSYCL
eukprot:1285991-Amphidinium_carterae.1